MGQTKRKTVSDRLRWQIEHCGRTRYRISKDTGINQAALHRFVVVQTGLSLETVDKLADYFGLELGPRAEQK